MGKPEALAEGPAAVRPPRPAPRQRFGNAAPLASSSHPVGQAVVSAPEPAATLGVERVEEALLRPELLVLDVPVVALEKPSTRLEPTPSPVPRVSLVPAAGTEPHTRSLSAGLDSRNLPTIAVRQVAPARPFVREVASAMTFPPGRAARRDARIARRLAADVRSSKREIVFGLSIGMALAAALGIIGQRYLAHREPLPQASAAVAAAPPAERLAPEHQEWALQPRAEQLPLAEPELPSSAGKPPSGAHGVAAAPSEAAPARRAPARKTAKSARVAATPQPAPPADVFSAEPRGEAGGWIDESKPRAKAPPSPAESAGLGLDLPL